MTTLTITPDIAKKRLKVAGKVASGEKVAVTILGFGSASTTGLRLRVMAGNVAVGVFPLADGDDWTVDGANLTCALNLSTEQAERLCKFGAETRVILEDTETPQLYGVADLQLCSWIKLADVDVPVNLDNYKVKIGDLEEEVSQVHATLNAHIADKTNPHGVTKSQIGLGSVDNTSDMAKPVSTAQQAAIDAVRSAASNAVLAEQKRATSIETENRQMIYELKNAVDGKLPKSAFAALSGETLADGATQKEMRQMVQKILGILQRAATCIMLAFALPASGIDADTAWEDVPPTNTVKSIVEQFSAATVKSVNGMTGDVALAASDVGALPASGTALRAASVGTDAEWTDATGCVWRVAFDVERDWWTIDPASDGMSIRWGGDSWVLRYEGYDNDTKRGADAYALSFRLGGTRYVATRHPGGETNCVGRIATTNDIPTALSAFKNDAGYATTNDLAVVKDSFEGVVYDAMQAAFAYTDAAVSNVVAQLRMEAKTAAADLPRLVTNAVAAVLAPTPLEFRYTADGSQTITNAFIVPNNATSPMHFTREGEATEGGSAHAFLYPSGTLRNYEVVVDALPAETKALSWTFDDLWATHRIYATPTLYEDALGDFAHGWRLTADDLPCVVTIREPEAGLLVIRRDRVGVDSAEIRIESGEPVLYEK